MRKRIAGAALATVLGLTVAGCSGSGAKVSSTAIRDFAGIARTNTRTIELSGDDVSRLADQAGVSDDVIRDVAPQLDQQSVWQASLQGVRTIYEQTPEEIRSNLVGIACDVAQGDITTVDELYANIAQRFKVYSEGEIAGIVDSVAGLWSELDEAFRSSSPEARAGAVIACFTAEQLVG